MNRMVTKSMMKHRSSVTRNLKSPADVANALEWKKQTGTVLTMLISKRQIDLALCGHPEYYYDSYDYYDHHSYQPSAVRMIQPIPITSHTTNHNYKELDPIVSQQLYQVVQQYNVCGIIVGWPVEKGGWWGASCGRVIHTLDQLGSVSTSSSSTSPLSEYDDDRQQPLLSDNRPICLYDVHHYIPTDDEWGRSTIYCETTKKHIEVITEHEFCCDNDNHESTTTSSHHKSMIRRTTTNVQDVANEIWTDFCDQFWSNIETKQVV